MIGKKIRLWIPALNCTSQVTYTVIEYVGADSYKIECDTTGTRTFATVAAMRLEGCYSPALAHGTCLAGHPVHLDVDHYDTPRWVHCTVADLMTCPAEMSDLAGDYVGKHRVTS